MKVRSYSNKYLMSCNFVCSCSADHIQKSARRPLAVRKPSDSLTAKENVPPEACVRKQFTPLQISCQGKTNIECSTVEQSEIGWADMMCNKLGF